MLGDDVTGKAVWEDARMIYAQQIGRRNDLELAETFFNSVTRRIFTTIGVNENLEFVWFGATWLPIGHKTDIYNAYVRLNSTESMVTTILNDCHLDSGWADLVGDARRVAKRLDAHLTMSQNTQSSIPDSYIVTFTAPYEVRVQSRPRPAPAANELLVTTEVSAISPGSEMLFYRGQAPQDMPADATIPGLRDESTGYPISYGYACVGVVTEQGDEVAEPWLGRRVFAFHPHASHFTVRPQDAHPVPADLTPEQAALLPNMETAVNLVMDGAPLIGERVAVMGQGVVGLMTAGLLARFPLAELLVVDPLSARRELGERLGVTRAVAPDACEDEGDFDLVYELSGSPHALDQAVALAGYAGRVVIGSWYGNKEVRLSLGGAFHRSRIRLISSQVSTVDPRWSGRWSKARRFRLAWRMLATLDARALITHRLPVQEAAKAYRLLDQEPAKVIQIIFNY
jgi:2-desacetyl-2-hydroxyethyl bacteriochlorophyllide A dehydrogenase